MDHMTEAACNVCKAIKPRDDFYLWDECRDSSCKSCHDRVPDAPYDIEDNFWYAFNNMKLLDEFFDTPESGCIGCWIVEELHCIEEAVEELGGWEGATQHPDFMSLEMACFEFEHLAETVEDFFELQGAETPLGFFVQALKRELLDAEDTMMVLTGEPCVDMALEILHPDDERIIDEATQKLAGVETLEDILNPHAH